MSKGLFLKSLMGVFTSFVALAATASQGSLQCETLGESNTICLSDVPERPVAAPAQKGSGVGSMVTREELSGGAIDLGNEFEMRTVLGDATAAPRSDLGETGGAQMAQARLNKVETFLQPMVFSTSKTYVGAARLKRR